MRLFLVVILQTNYVGQFYGHFIGMFGLHENSRFVSRYSHALMDYSELRKKD